MKKIQTILLTLLSLLVYGMQALITGFLASLVIIAALINWMWATRSIIKTWGNLMFFSMGKRLHVTGKENIQKNHKYILLANHASLYDIPAIMAVFSRVSWLGKEVLTKIPLFGYALKKIDYIPVKRPLTSGARRIINESIKNADNITVAIFPEGTRTLDGYIQDFKRGFILILKGTGLDVLPITLNGTFKLKPKPRFLLNPFTRIDMIIHQPIANAVLCKKSNDEILAQMKTIIEAPYVLGHT